jgi:serine/threonine-protein kinase
VHDVAVVAGDATRVALAVADENAVLCRVKTEFFAQVCAKLGGFLVDCDFYSKNPVYGSEFLWGCSRIASPEERVDGAIIDEISNVYNMGAVAFCLLVNDGENNRSREDWPLSDELYAVVKKAVSNERSDRQQSIRQLIEEWRAAKA